ncbi:MAG: sulfotransferase [Boseongicola sp.]
MTVVLICVGAAKAGTSWLHSQLAEHPECHFRAIKELHYFSAFESGRSGAELAKHRDIQAEMLDRFARSGMRPTDEQAARLSDRANWLDVLETKRENVRAYLRYLETGAGQAKVVGEMTPAYALLSEERLVRIARMAPDVRILYLMREPVDRLWSHIRMIAARRDGQGRVTARRCDKILNRVIEGDEDQIAKRSDYASALTKLLAAIPAGKLLIEVFEDMIAGDAFARICDFLGIARVEPNRVPVHEGQPLDMTAAQRDTATAWLAPQYDAAAQVLGGLPDAWSRKG